MCQAYLNAALNNEQYVLMVWFNNITGLSNMQTNHNVPSCCARFQVNWSDINTRWKWTALAKPDQRATWFDYNVSNSLYFLIFDQASLTVHGACCLSNASTISSLYSFISACALHVFGSNASTTVEALDKNNISSTLKKMKSVMRLTDRFNSVQQHRWH